MFVTTYALGFLQSSLGSQTEIEKMTLTAGVFDPLCYCHCLVISRLVIVSLEMLPVGLQLYPTHLCQDLSQSWLEIVNSYDLKLCSAKDLL